ncbi:ABC-type uncharacterized transport system auxiliary subunit [Lipingzhangella halophila]|uniref:ABC-type uncharacterized transport system auxiliary subunit n=1 Tax=Lipingzhangella halophila TaxID=1783352 RepID=A0A7W7RKE8_9ACTN|nr:hypothetical protein [Lipingzhangella halophila]MBB4933602.1 ABC-type uncharacterized transport system auxiliary subunit [Lipingzhangella halophila]
MIPARSARVASLALLAAAALALTGCQYHSQSCNNDVCTLTTNSQYEDEFSNGDRYGVQEISPGESATVLAGPMGNEATAELAEGESADLGGYTATVEAIEEDEVTVVFEPQ